ncbi:NUDIX domain-containing protein [Streptacidiphilus sp. P02-A3a]|uniref:NUDIX domain-containing protein n=1 Tax=Streptacidiphilus sp. P02-A3a TaxID=2704468 RepID=UPI0015FA840B|nr:NUDIX domain-containing protein [Streptacidiphilus sp. P02-A3a]QMU67272.1 NUDIX domain-containing protein [Streptacidiphilus sp. P02-A3a]
MDPTVADSQPDDTSAAARELDAALRTTGSNSYLHMRDTMSAVAILVYGDERTRESYVGPWTVPLTVAPDEAKALERALASFGVNAEVTIAGVENLSQGTVRAFRIGFAAAADVRRFARRLVENLPEPAATARRLHRALAKAGINQWVGWSNGAVVLDTVAAVDAAALCGILGERVGESIEQDLDTADGPWVEQLAAEIDAVLSAILGERIGVDPVPVCRTCAISRDNWVDFGSISLAVAQRLVLALEAATPPSTDPSVPTGPPAPVDDSPKEQPVSPNEPRPYTDPLSPEVYAAGRAALWVSAAVLFTHQDGRVLLLEPTYRPTLVLVGGGVERGEYPSHAAARETAEETGLQRAFDTVLVVDTVLHSTAEADPRWNFPGAIHYVFDGGTLTDDEITGMRMSAESHRTRLLLPGALPDYMTAGEARRTQAALQARASGTTVILNNGHPLTGHPPRESAATPATDPTTLPTPRSQK